MAGFFPAAVRVLADVVYPPVCCACAKPLDPRKNAPAAKKLTGGASRPDSEISFAGVMAAVMCGECIRTITPIIPPMCPVCGNMFASREAEDHVCGACLEIPRRFSRARAAGAYETSLMAAVHKLKYGGKTGLAGPLGMLLLSAFAKWFDPAGVDLVVPVPLHRHKFRRRGFNQAYLLIRQWHRQAQALGLSFDR
ncbi:MAG: ComF family protein, partial [Thermodesulfobacteriota bacterium]